MLTLRINAHKNTMSPSATQIIFTVFFRINAHLKTFGFSVFVTLT